MSNATSVPPKPKSSPIGKIIIGLLLVVLAFEAVPYLRMTLAHTRLLAELKKAEGEDHKVTADVVTKILGGRAPDFTKLKRAPVGQELYAVYYFNGLLKRRELCVHYDVQGRDDPDGKNREVIELMPNLPEEILVDDEPLPPLTQRPESPPPSDTPQAADPTAAQEKTSPETQPTPPQTLPEEPTTSPTQPAEPTPAPQESAPKDEAASKDTAEPSAPAAPALPEN